MPDTTKASITITFEDVGDHIVTDCVMRVPDAEAGSQMPPVTAHAMAVFKAITSAMRRNATSEMPLISAQTH